MANITDVKLPDNSQYDLKDNVSGYASKVLSATTDDLASLTATGDLADSGKKLSDLVLKSDVKDVLNSTSTTDPLSANMGRALADNLAANENVYGAKQMLPYPFNETTKTDNGITFTDNGNGTITVNGIASNDTNFFCRNRITDPMYLKNGTYKFTGCPSGGGSSSYEVDLIYQNSGGSIIYLIDVGNGLEFTVNGSYGDADGANFGVIVTIFNGANLTTPVTFKPMIRDARVIDDTWVPYTPTNRELMSYKANGRVGAKNFNSYPYYETTKTENGITFTDNGDGTITVSGTASATASFGLHQQYTGYKAALNIKNGTYRLDGCPENGSASTYKLDWVYRRSGDGSFEVLHDYGQGGTMTINGGYYYNDSVLMGASIVVYSGTALPVGGITFKPMIRIAEDTDPNYQPFAKTNKQLTDDKAERADLATLNLTGSTNATGAQIDEGTYFYLNDSYCKATTNIANGATFTLNTNFETVSVGGELFKITPRYITQIAVGATRSLTTELPRSYIIATYGSIGSALTIQAGVGYGKESSRHKTQSIISSSDVVYAVNDLTYGLDITNNTSTALTVSIIKLL